MASSATPVIYRCCPDGALNTTPAFNKRTNNAYDFNVLFNTSVTFPISWQMSKLDGVSLRVNLTNYKGLTAFMVAGHTRARFFPPESGGLFFNSNLPSGVFRIDHDQNLEQT